MTIQPLTGGCACGAIRYEAKAEPMMMLNCHCQDCQRSNGGSFASFVLVPKETFQVTRGALRFYGSPSEAGGLTQRGFCAECGSPVAGMPEAVPHIAAIRAGSLDDPNRFETQMEVWTIDAPAGDRLNPDVPHFEKYPG